MPWHPPIPSELATRPAVRALKCRTAILLLLHLYDDLHRDGSVLVNLKEMTSDHELGEPYGTLRRWWSELREGPFFKKVEDLGRKGYKVWLADDWIDWHILRTNYGERSPVSVEVRPVCGERSPVSVEEAIVGSSTLAERSSMSVEAENERFNVSSTLAERSSMSVENLHVWSHDYQGGGGDLNTVREGSEPSPPPPDETAQDDLAIALLRACGLEGAPLSPRKRTSLNTAYSSLSAAGVQPERLARFPDWWRDPGKNWRARKAKEAGRQLTPATPDQVVEAWPEYQATRQRAGPAPPAPTASPSDEPVLSPAERARLARELRGKHDTAIT